MKFGIIAPKRGVKAWHALVLDHIGGVGGVTGALALTYDIRGDRPTGSWEARRYQPRKSALFGDLSVDEILPGVQRIKTMADVDTEGRLTFPDECARDIQALNLDFLLFIGLDPIDGGILRAARHGIWAFQFGDADHYGSNAPGFWEVYDGNALTYAALVRIGPTADAAIKLRGGFFRTRERSARKNLEHVCELSACWPASVCRDIMAGAGAYLDQPGSPQTSTDRPAPSLRDRMVCRAIEWANVASWIGEKLFRPEYWHVGLVSQSLGEIVESGRIEDARWMPLSEPGRFIADPFSFTDQGTRYLAVEDYSYRLGRGRLIALPLDQASPKASTASEVLSRPYHLSYPFIYEENDRTYMVPETARAGEIALYEKLGGPDQWKRLQAIVPGIGGIDPTLFKYEGRYWLAFSDVAQGFPYEQLCLAFSDNLAGPWQLHPANPVKTDVRSTRGAGTPFMHKGVLYRPAQDCSLTYGGQIIINRIVELTPTTFREEEAATIKPSPNWPYPDGLHTLSACGPHTLIDAKEYRVGFTAIGSTLMKAVRMAAARLGRNDASPSARRSRAGGSPP